MKHTNILLTLLLLFGLFACQDTKLGDVDLDFGISLASREVKTYIGKPVRIAITVNPDDEKNTYPFQTKIKFSNGTLKVNGETKNSDEAISFDYKSKGTLTLEFVPDKTGKQDISITIKNEKVDKMVVCTVDCVDALYDLEIQDAPERALIDTKFDFTLLVKEAELTGADSIVAYAKVVKGAGFVYAGEQLINGGASDSTAGNASQTTVLAVGKNNITYRAIKEGENIIRFYVTNKYGYETFQDISTQINLPEWKLSNSVAGNSIEVPFQDNYSFTLNLTEKDIFKDNTYEGFFRVLSNTDLSLKVNDKSYAQGATIPLKAGGNVGVLNVKATGAGSIEFIVKDKYKQEHKDTLRFTSKLPLKPIDMSLDKSSQSVKINQVAAFKLTLNEQNYTDVFTVKYQIVSGTGAFEGGATQSLSTGTHTLKYTPSSPGSHTFKIIVSDTNKQTKELSATVQASLSPLTASLSTALLNLVQGEKGTGLLTVNEADYTGKFYLKYTTAGTAGRFDAGTVNLGVGGVAIFEGSTLNIGITPSVLGTTTYTLTLEDDYHQTKELTLKAVTKGKVTVTAASGGTVSGGGNFDLNQSCTLKATPNPGYGFLGWYKSGNLVSNQTSYMFAVTESTSLEARFATNAYTVGVTADTGGSATGSGTYEHGKTATVKATVNNGYTFDGWYEGATRLTAALEYSFVVNSNKSLIAKFIPNSYNITVNATVGGGVSGAGSYKHGTTATLTATANTGYSFLGWYLNGSKVSDSPSYTFTVAGTAGYEAKFSPNKLNIVVNAEEGGEVSGSGIYDFGSNVTLRAMPKANYSFIGWFEGTTNVSTNLTYTFTVSKALTLTAKFQINKFTVTLSGVNGTQSGAGSYVYNTNATMKATPNAGYEFVGWYEGNSQVSTSNPYIFAVTKDRILEAKYQPLKYTITLSGSGKGGTISGGGTYGYNQNIRIEAAPAQFYKFDGWFQNGVLISTANPYVFAAKESKNLEARFTYQTGTITLSANNTSIVTYYNETINATCNISSTTYSSYKIKIVPTGASSCSYTVNGINADNQSEITVPNGSFTIGVKSLAKKGNATFKVVAYSDPLVQKELSMNVVNNGVRFTITSSSGWVLSNTNASQSGWFESHRGAKGSGQITIGASSPDDFSLYPAADNGVREYIISNAFTNPQSLKDIDGTKSIPISFTHVTVQVGQNQETGLWGSTTYGKTYFDFDSSKGGTVSRNFLKSSLGWVATQTDYIIVRNSAGYELKAPITIKFNR